MRDCSFVLTNARLVLPDSVATSSLVVRDGRIHSIGAASPDLPAIDCEGDHILPGLVEIHTDNLERHLEPERGVASDGREAFVAHDQELVRAGITTVLDAIAVGDTVPGGFRTGLLTKSLDAFLASKDEGQCVAQHFVHLRCELTDPACADLFAAACARHRPTLVSLMDHTPGQRQWQDLDRYRQLYGARHALAPEALERLIQERRARQEVNVARNRARVLEIARPLGALLASHDDSEVSHVELACRDGARVCEFPTTLLAAREARRRGLAIVAGAPNLIRGGSHAGNVAAIDLLRHELVDILSSDYEPRSLLSAVFQMPHLMNVSLARAVAMATQTPARALGLTDRGSLEPGKRADLIRIHPTNVGVLIRGVWCDGARIDFQP
jgi:alpha-D-ribose 1-methylphosphonate 5-triphosphate diphosphatase